MQGAEGGHLGSDGEAGKMLQWSIFSESPSNYVAKANEAAGVVRRLERQRNRENGCAILVRVFRWKTRKSPTPRVCKANSGNKTKFCDERAKKTQFSCLTLRFWHSVRFRLPKA